MERGSFAMTALTRITLDPEVMGGKPCIRGLRITVGTIVGLVASGRTVPDVDSYQRFKLARHLGIKGGNLADELEAYAIDLLIEMPDRLSKGRNAPPRPLRRPSGQPAGRPWCRLGSH
jgi:hypothetical protein